MDGLRHVRWDEFVVGARFQIAESRNSRSQPAAIAAELQFNGVASGAGQ
jgi:hypothetical protein